MKGKRVTSSPFQACHGCVQTHIAMGCAFTAGVLCCKLKDLGLNSDTQTGKVSRTSLFISLTYGEIAVAKSTWEEFCLTVEQKMVQNILKFWKNNGMLC